MRLLQSMFMAAVLLFGASAGAQLGPQELVKDTSDRVLEQLRAQQQELERHPGRIYELVREIVVPHFDFDSMARSVLAKYWQRATPEQRRRFTEEFRTLLVRTYASSLLEYSGQQVQYLPLRDSEGDAATVRTEILQPSGPSIPVDYRLEKRNGEWKVTEVVIDDLNLVLNYRSSFGNEIRQIGLDETIKKLAARNQQATE